MVVERMHEDSTIYGLNVCARILKDKIAFVRKGQRITTGLFGSTVSCKEVFCELWRSCYGL